MISGAARFATEKAVFRPALPMSFSPGISEMQMAKPYFERLKDPRWQKKRLEALTAAQWKCSSCQDAESTLHVHHRQYFKGREPWDYDAGQLEVLCESCHTLEHEDPTPDPLLVAASYVPTTGPFNRDAAASLIAGYCGHGMSVEHCRDPESYLIGQAARQFERCTSINSLIHLAEAMEKRDRWTMQEAIDAFLLDLKTRPDAVPPVQKNPL